jgi:hypothetical protein
MRTSTRVLLSLLCITAAAGTGCGSVGSGGEDVSVETGDTGEPEGPLDPTPSEAPLVPGALWSLEWGVADTIPRLDHGPLGLGLATTQRCALIDAETGALVWSVAAPTPAAATVLRLVDDELVWARRGPSGGWTVSHYDGSGDDAGVVAIEGTGALAIDANGMLFVEGGGELAGYDADGNPSWAAELSPGYSLGVLDGLADGVVVLEVGDELVEEGEHQGEVQFRLRRFDGVGESLASVDFTAPLALIDDLAVAGDRVYAGASGGLGLPGAVFAVDFGTGLAWSLEFGTNIPVTVEPGVGDGAYLVDGDQLVHIDADSTAHELGPASTLQGSDSVLLEVGASAELFAGAITDGLLELNRLE